MHMQGIKESTFERVYGFWKDGISLRLSQKKIKKKVYSYYQVQGVQKNFVLRFANTYSIIERQVGYPQN